MLVEQTMQKLVSMKLQGMAEALRRWIERPKATAHRPLPPGRQRRGHRLPARARGLAKSVMLDLAACRWVTSHQNVIFTGLTGVGKSYLAFALGTKACRDGYTVVYRRASRLLDDVAQARADGTHLILLRRLAKTDVLILDDFGLAVLNAAQRKDLLEVLEDRYGTTSTIVTSQLEPKEWHSVIGHETIADAVCDRLVHNAHRLKLGGESIRKVKGDLTKAKKTAK
jgi:DNA replication protein DnaC